MKLNLDLNLNISANSITDEELTVTDNSKTGLAHDRFFGEPDFEIWTGAGSGGDRLQLNVDFTLDDADGILTTEAGRTVYSKLRILNSDYHNITLYVTYHAAGDIIDANDFGDGAYKNTGTSEGELVEVQSGGALPTLDGSNLTGISANPGGNDTNIQFNDGGSFGGSDDLVWDNTGKSLTINGDLIVTAHDATFYGIRVGRGPGESSTNTVVGSNALGANTTGTQNVAIGVNSLTANDTGVFNTSIGANSLFTADADHNIAIGSYAGYYETGSNTLYIDSYDRSSLSGGQTSSLIYGVFNSSSVENQELRVNAKFLLPEISAASQTADYGTIYVSSVDNNLHFVDSSGNDTDLLAGAGGVPGGADTNVQFNNGGSFDGDSGLAYDGAGSLTVGKEIVMDDDESSIVLGFNSGYNVLQTQSNVLSSSITAMDSTFAGDDVWIVIIEGPSPSTPGAGGPNPNTVRRYSYDSFTNTFTTEDEVTGVDTPNNMTNPALAIIGENAFYYIDSNNEILRLFSGTSELDSLTVTGITKPAITAIGLGGAAVLADPGLGEIRYYTYGGAISETNTLSVTGMDNPAVASLGGTYFAYADSGNDEVRIYEIDGGNNIVLRASLSVSGMTEPEVARKGDYKFWLIDPGIDEIRAYTYNDITMTITEDLKFREARTMNSKCYIGSTITATPNDSDSFIFYNPDEDLIKYEEYSELYEKSLDVGSKLTSNGGKITVFGNDHSTNPGDIIIEAGASGTVQINSEVVMNELILPATSGAPSDSPTTGATRFDAGANTLYIYNGSAWVSTTLT